MALRIHGPGTWKKETNLILGTWNIRTMLQAGKMNEIATELSKLKFDIMALQEIR